MNRIERKLEAYATKCATQNLVMTQHYSLPKAKRLRSPQDFSRVYDLRQRAGDGNLLVFAARNGLGYTRLGLSVSKKHGNAVRRARLKRLLREAFRLSQHDLPGGLDLILIPRHGPEAALDDYRGSLVYLARKLDRRIDAKPE